MQHLKNDRACQAGYSGVLPAIHSFEPQPSDHLQAVFPAVLDFLDAMACVCLIWPLMCWRRRVDLGMLLALLAAVSRASCEERLAAAYKLLLWQAGTPLLPRPLAVAYVRLLKVSAPLSLAGKGDLVLDASKHSRAKDSCLEAAAVIGIPFLCLSGHVRLTAAAPHYSARRSHTLLKAAATACWAGCWGPHSSSR